MVCPNSPYRDHALAELRELVGRYDFEGIFLDMTFWPDVCYCAHCTERFRKEQHAEPPRIVNWDDPTWRAFQRAREQWMLEFAMVGHQDHQGRSPHHRQSPIFHDLSRLEGRCFLAIRDACDYIGGDFYGGPTQYSLVCKAYEGLTRMRPFEFHTSRTTDLSDFETIKPFNELLTSCCVATLHSAANLVIDSINVDGTLNPGVYKFLEQQNARRAPYEPFLGGEMLADVAVYYDKESLYDPTENGVHVADAKGRPHMPGVVGAARILREAHVPYGVVTNVNLDTLSNYRAVIVPNAFEMTAEQASEFRASGKGRSTVSSGPSSLNRFDPRARAFCLEDVSVFLSCWGKISRIPCAGQRSSGRINTKSSPQTILFSVAWTRLEILISSLGARLNLRILDLPIRYRERVYGDTNIQRWKHGVLLLRMAVIAALRLKFA